MKPGATSFWAICEECVHEKNSPFFSRRAAWTRGEDSSDVSVNGEIALDLDKLAVKCPYGHEHLVLRRGSQIARNFSIPD